MSLLPPVKVGKLQATLPAKAKSAPTYRCDALYDKVYRMDVLALAYRCGRANDGTAGVDGQTGDDIQAYGPRKWLGERAEELRKKTYRPQAVRRVYIPKADGTQRPLAIPTLEDKILQRAVVLVLEPIYEQDFRPCSYGFRPGRSAQQALQALWQQVMDLGGCWLVEVDIRKYFIDLWLHPECGAFIT